MKKIVNFLEGIAAGAALFSVMAVTVITVVAINPKTDTNSMVAGVQTQQERLGAPVIIKEVGSQREVVASYDGGHYVFKYSKTILAPDINIYKYSFVNIKNPEGNDVVLSITAFPETQVQNGVKVWIIDETDRVLLYSPEQNNSEKNITISKLSSRNFLIEYEMLDKINYPFTTVFSIKQS